jgi:hypothetical protein
LRWSVVHTHTQILPSASQQRVTVVGDTHGQYHDLCRLFEQFGAPSSERVYIFNGARRQVLTLVRLIVNALACACCP